ncbi:MAG: hypothetical protein QOE35_2679 [Actinomycetota bacterium]
MLRIFDGAQDPRWRFAFLYGQVTKDAAGVSLAMKNGDTEAVSLSDGFIAAVYDAHDDLALLNVQLPHSVFGCPVDARPDAYTAAC